MSEREATNVCSLQFVLLNKFIKLVGLLFSFCNCTQQLRKVDKKEIAEEEADRKRQLQMGNCQ